MENLSTKMETRNFISVSIVVIRKIKIVNEEIIRSGKC